MKTLTYGALGLASGVIFAAASVLLHPAASAVVALAILLYAGLMATGKKAPFLQRLLIAVIIGAAIGVLLRVIELTTGAA
jgi:hypothetical protein